LAPFSPAPISFDTTSVFTTLHPKLDGYFPLFLKNYKPNQDLELFSNSLKLAFQHMPHYHQVLLLGWFLNIFGTVSLLQNVDVVQ
jgi:hypothetical protein